MSARIASAHNPEPLRAAQALVEAKISLIPIGLNGRKEPFYKLLPQVQEGDKWVGKWEEFKQRLPNPEELKRWFDPKQPAGLAAICGKVSGNLECIDFDYEADANFPEWRELVEVCAPGLLVKLTVNKSPKGYHVYYRCPGEKIPGKMNLALGPDRPKNEQTLIETRGEGNYILTPGCPWQCHPLNRPYEHHAGPELAQVVQVTPEERETLLNAARQFDRRPVQTPSSPAQKSQGSEGLRPGDDFCRRGTPWQELLQGWKFLRQIGDKWYLERPGKEQGGVSATLGFRKGPEGDDLLYVFSSSAPDFEADRFYNRFQAYAALKHKNNWQAAATDLHGQGYGRMEAPTTKKEKEKKNGLLELAREQGLELFHTVDRQTWVSYQINGRLETCPVESDEFTCWLTRQQYAATQQAPSKQVIGDAQRVLRCQALWEAPLREVHCRIAAHLGRIYLDMANVRGNCIEIDDQGWRVIDNPPVRFRRGQGQKPLSLPIRGASLELLRPFVNVATEQGLLLLVAFLAATLRPASTYPLLVLKGEQGSAKSTLARICKRLVDPSMLDLLSESSDPDKLTLAAQHNHLLTYDNISLLKQEQSDAFCRMSTGGAQLARKLYSDADVCIHQQTRPVILNGITDIVKFNDLTERCLFVQLKPILDHQRREESELWGQFEEVEPGILGALLDAVSTGLRYLPEVKEKRLPRMADFARWGEAVWRGLGLSPGVFLEALFANRQEANAVALEEDLVASVLIPWILELGGLMDKPGEVLKRLSERAGKEVSTQKGWPSQASQLTAKLNRLTPALRRAGIEFDYGKSGGTGGSRFYSFSVIEKGSSPSSPSSPDCPNSKPTNCLLPDGVEEAVSSLVVADRRQGIVAGDEGGQEATTEGDEK